MLTYTALLIIIPTIATAIVMLPVARLYGSIRGAKGYDPGLCAFDMMIATLVFFALATGIAFLVLPYPAHPFH